MREGGATRAGLFITWCTSVSDCLDHAVTDEAFAEHRSAPVTVCGATVTWGPMELPSAAKCALCRKVLAYNVWVPGRPAPVRHASLWTRAVSPFGWIAGVGHQVLSDLGDSFPPSAKPAPSPGPRDRDKPPVAVRSHSAAAGDTAGEGTTSAQPLVSSPAHFVSDTVSVTGARPAAQPSLLRSTVPSAASAPGLGGPNSSAPLSSPGAAETASTGDAAAGTVVLPGQRANAPRQDDHPPPAAGLSSADPESRDCQQDARPRRCVLLTETPIELADAAWFRHLRPSPATMPALSQR